MKSRVRKKYIGQMKDKTGAVHTERASIANIFADFYEELYAARPTPNTPITMEGEDGNIPPFTEEEFTKAMKSLKTNRCKDSAGVKAEMLKNGGSALASVLLDLYNRAITKNMELPKAWKHSVVTVLFKSGDAMLPQNYRPICIIPLLYKLFSKLLYNRLYPILDKAQCPDQAGFRHKFSTTDHMFVFTMIYEKSEEFQLNSWVAALDFKKAFDSIDQNYLWAALKEQLVPCGYIQVLQNLYKDQHAQVKTERLSRTFAIHRGTKQGDPLSSMLFNALLEKMISSVKRQIDGKKYGIQMGPSDETRMTNLRFADDVLVIGRSLSQISHMLELIYLEGKICGLQLHPDKTKIISSTNRTQGRPKSRYISIGDMRIEVLPRDSSIKYLGRQINFGTLHEDELGFRLRAGWAKFAQHKQELISRHYSLNDRLRLFESIITPTVLYGSECWTMTKVMERALQRTQRRMLRMILGHGRRRIPIETHENESAEGADVQSNASDPAKPEEADENPEEDPQEDLEPWVDWIRRVTHHVEERLAYLRIRKWIEQARLRKWKWAEKTFTSQNMERWSVIALHWNPQIHYDKPKPTARRKPMRPNMRWLDDIVKITRGSSEANCVVEEVWRCREFWTKYEGTYVKRV